MGRHLAAISPQSPDQSLSTAEKAALSFEVLSDSGSRLARRIGIAFEQADEVLGAQRKLGLDLAQVNEEGSTELPMPTVLIVDPDRTVGLWKCIPTTPTALRWPTSSPR